MYKYRIQIKWTCTNNNYIYSPMFTYFHPRGKKMGTYFLSAIYEILTVGQYRQKCVPYAAYKLVGNPMFKGKINEQKKRFHYK